MSKTAKKAAPKKKPAKLPVAAAGPRPALNATTIQAVAERMRRSYGEWLGEDVVPWKDSDKQEVWLKIAEDGLTTYEQILSQ